MAAGHTSLFYGNYSASKSALALSTIGLQQRKGKICAYVDAEMTFDKSWAEKLGVNTKELILIQKKTFPSILREVQPIIRSGVDLMAIDSISSALAAAFTGEDDQAVDFDSMKQIGAHAKSNTIFQNAIHTDNINTAFFQVSQVTNRITNQGASFMPHGGLKMTHIASQIIRMGASPAEKEQKMGEIWVGDKVLQVPIGRDVNYFVEKNKLGPPSRRGTYTFYYAGDHIGIDYYGELVSLGEQFGIIEKAGAWYSYEGTKAQGSAKFADILRNENELREVIEKKILMMNTGKVDE